MEARRSEKKLAKTEYVTEWFRYQQPDAKLTPMLHVLVLPDGVFPLLREL